MIIWGGRWSNTAGGMFNDKTGWKPLPTLGAPIGRSYHSATWTGISMFIFGGSYDYGDLADGGVYDPRY
jgi:hypothetical protein